MPTPGASLSSSSSEPFESENSTACGTGVSVSRVDIRAAPQGAKGALECADAVGVMSEVAR